MQTTDTDVLQAVTDAAAALLTDPFRRRAAVSYLEQRGIDARPLSEHWLLGYAPPGWTRLVDRLSSQFGEQALVDAGVGRYSSRGTLIDTFRDRVIFGVHSADGSLAGFLGRDVSGSPGAPKYVNTRRNAVFDKGALLYGLYEGASDGGGRQPVVVEGPLDVLAIATRNSSDLLAMAACGTAFTAAHARQIAQVAFRSESPVVVAMDSDAAGRTAALGAGERLREMGLDVWVAMLPNGSDPAEYLAQPSVSIDAFRADHALPLINAYVQQAIARQGDRMQWAEGRVAALRSVTSYLATYPPTFVGRQIAWLTEALQLDRTIVIRELAEACVSAEMRQPHAVIGR
jgi:DNA primase